jgi:peptide/nickel transport system permease protein
MSLLRRSRTKKDKEKSSQPREVTRSQGQLIWRAFRRHHLGTIGMVIIAIFTLIAIFAEFFMPYPYAEQFRQLPFAPPSALHWSEDGTFVGPFIYATQRVVDQETYAPTFVENKSTRYYLRFFTHASEYKLLGLFKTDIHLFGAQAEDGSTYPLFVFGSDNYGRDIFSRAIFGSRVSLAVGPLVVLFSFPIAIFLGGVSGYYGGGVDMIMQRVGEVFLAIPGFPILLAAGAALAGLGLSPVMVFLGIIIALSLVSWAGTARVIRGQILAIREMDFVNAARATGASDVRVILRHIIPNVTSYLVVSATLTIPGMMLTEAGLSFLGYGIREPMTSWGQLLNGASNISGIQSHPWQLIPGGFIVISVLAFNFMGDALRDAVDPFSII